MTNEEFQKLVLEKLSNLEEQLSETKEQLSETNGQLKETNGFVKSLMHRTEEINAELHNLGHAINQLNGRVGNLEEAQKTNKDNFERIEAKLDILTLRVMANDGEIQLLKKAKIMAGIHLKEKDHS